MAKTQYYTREGLEKLKNELNELQTAGRSKMAKAIAEARDKGDLSENAEYDAAKDAQGLLELKISKLSVVVANGRILDESKIDASKVSILSKIKIKHLGNGMEMNYTIVSEEESDLKLKKMSIDSPIGKGLLGKEVGDVVDVKTPSGITRFEIIEIAR